MKKITYSFFLIAFFIIFINSIFNIYEKRKPILSKLGFDTETLNININKEISVNALEYGDDKQEPTFNLDELTLTGNEHLLGKVSKPFDWNVTAIHSVLLPNYKVMTFGSYAIKEELDDANIKLTDDFILNRNAGDHQWAHHDVQGGVDIDIWDLNKGFEEESHEILMKPLVWDAFCSIVRVINDKEVLILGGNKEPKINGPDSQKDFVKYDLEKNEFQKLESFSHPRWYASIVRDGFDNYYIFGGMDIVNKTYSDIPEKITVDTNGVYKVNDVILPKEQTFDFFSNKDADEWNYPKSFLLSNGMIFGISYNKLWLFDPKEKKLYKVGEIKLNSSENNSIRILANDELETDSHLLMFNENHKKKNPDGRKMTILNMSAPVGTTASALMIKKDKILIIGGKQQSIKSEFMSSNEMMEIDLSNPFQPVIKKLKAMNYPRSNGNAIILPNGKIFSVGGTALNDRDFSVFNPEIYDPKLNEWKILSPIKFRRNYHSTALLLPNGTILLAGGDVWNAELYYPPYLFEKDWDGKTKIAERPEIVSISLSKITKQNKNLQIKTNKIDSIKKITLLSTGAATHAQGSEPKYIEIDFEKKMNNLIELSIPDNKNILQNGTYLLFLVDNSDTPSIGKILTLSR